MVFDAHLDLSMNALDWNRDFRQTVAHIRQREAGMTDKPDRGNNTVSFPAMREGDIGLCVATLIARYVKTSNPLPGWHSPQQAWAQTQGQLAWYREMERAGELVQIRDLEGLERQLTEWPEHRHTIGYVLSLEGADSIVSLEHLDMMYESGLRALGPAHYGPGTYAFGTDSTGGIGEKGRALLAAMEAKNIILDATHLCDVSFWESMDHFNGPVWASHNNCRALVDHNRQFSDEQIRELISRDAVIGGALDAWMMVPGWIRRKSTPQEKGVTLNVLIDHLDHICQLAGNTRHIGIGTDLDGGFGTEQGPADLDTIADLQKLPDLLSQRGYTDEDIAGFMYGNWLRFLRKAWA
ncbi:dipeptidase [Flavilitoribacter nigricans]|uniref:Peptidase M19 n=1 Tax=Flavilitoribacter nigricans (strain ATCC 23147 / DSM 23189 / NBRC 102662 / NCIMB 1420 / SS-2) TaxID=1122177 RepID=A0A2D0N761_FLAN2|nr:membrane dipeptidase [Flavilitoribacter nigricans]PHN03969.1 peptidase M19 [Flavilitoribacter nigricans DSM 23189 = NBRC 102662]